MDLQHGLRLGLRLLELGVSSLVALGLDLAWVLELRFINFSLENTNRKSNGK
jgi:hypothetical protein